jgi:hypothetical protein
MKTPYRSRLCYSLERLHILVAHTSPRTESERERHRKHSARIAEPPAMDDDRNNRMGIVIVFGKINSGQGASTAGPSTAPTSMKTRRRGNCGKASATAW